MLVALLLCILLNKIYIHNKIPTFSMNDFKLFYKISDEVDKNENIPPVYLKKPIIVGLMEIDKSSKLVYNPNCIRYFKLPKMHHYPLNLNLGFEKYQFRSEIHLKNVVFRYLMDHHNIDDEHELNNADKAKRCPQVEFDVISHRGALAALLMAPVSVDFYRNWTIFATYYDKKLYLYKPYEIDDKFLNATTTFYHSKFGQYCLTDDPDQDPDTSSPIYEDEHMYCIYRSQLKNFNLIYSAEIDGILSDKKLENVQNFKELNECRFVHTKLMCKNIRNWRTNYRIQNWWSKSYFSAVNDIFVGFRNDLGIVDDPVEHILLHEIMQEQRWSPKVCSAFLHRILTKIVEEVKDVNCPYTTYEFLFDTPSLSFEFKKHEGKTDKSFLTDEYIKHITKNN